MHEQKTKRGENKETRSEDMMLLCPFCRQPTESHPEHNLNPGQKRMFGVIVQAGPAGIETNKFKERFFRKHAPPVTIRTTLYRLNRKIKPLKIVMRFGTIRLSDSGASASP